MGSEIIVAASILNADLAYLGNEMKSLEAAGVDWLHVDVMDGHFVPTITFGTNIVELAKKECGLFLDVHLMVSKPELHIQAFKDAGSGRITIHQEATPQIHQALAAIKQHGICSGVAINPGTPISVVLPLLDVVDLVLIMTVNPGWGGQSFISSTLLKISALREEIDRRQVPVVIEVDGGINQETAKWCIQAGASALVAGTYVVESSDRRKAIQSLKHS